MGVSLENYTDIWLVNRTWLLLSIVLTLLVKLTSVGHNTEHIISGLSNQFSSDLLKLLSIRGTYTTTDLSDGECLSYLCLCFPDQTLD